MLRSNKDKPCRVVHGHTFLVHTVVGTRVYWRCSKFAKNSFNCKARGASDGENGTIKLTNSEHNHAVNTVSPVKRERKRELKTAAAANRTTSSRDLASQAHRGLTPFELQQFPTERALQRVAIKERKVDNSKEADKMPMELKLPGELTKTVRGERFLLADSRDQEPEAPAFFVFASDFGCSLLREHRHWSVDGTFFASPKHFDNLLTVNVIIEDSSLPAAFIILPDRKQQTYERALGALFGKEQLQGVTPLTFLCDFEIGLVNAMNKLFPEAEERYCLFHLAKAVYNNIEKKGLHPLYDDPVLRALLRCFPSLAFLPVEEMLSGFNEVCAAFDELLGNRIDVRFTEQLRDFVKYFGDTYVGKVVNGTVRNARFSPEGWNCFARILSGQPRTNNGTEGWHASLNAQFPKSNMVLSQCVVRYQKEEERARNLVVRNALNPAEHIRGRTSKSSLREKNLLKAVQKYSDTPVEQRKRLEYLVTVQFHLSSSAFDRARKQAERASDATDASQLPHESTSQSSSQPAMLFRAASSSQPTSPFRLVSSSQPASPRQPVSPYRHAASQPAAAQGIYKRLQTVCQSAQDNFVDVVGEHNTSFDDDENDPPSNDEARPLPLCPPSTSTSGSQPSNTRSFSMYGGPLKGFSFF